MSQHPCWKEQICYRIRFLGQSPKGIKPWENEFKFTIRQEIMGHPLECPTCPPSYPPSHIQISHTVPGRDGGEGRREGEKRNDLILGLFRIQELLKDTLMSYTN